MTGRKGDQNAGFWCLVLVLVPWRCGLKREDAEDGRGEELMVAVVGVHDGGRRRVLIKECQLWKELSPGSMGKYNVDGTG